MVSRAGLIGALFPFAELVKALVRSVRAGLCVRAKVLELVRTEWCHALSEVARWVLRAM